MLKIVKEESKDKDQSKEEENPSLERGQSSSSSSSGIKREREPGDVVEKEDVIEDEQSVRGAKRESEVADREEVRRRKIELEQGTKRNAEEDCEQPVTTRLRIEMMEKDEIHEEMEEETAWMWNEVDYDAVTGQSLDPKVV